MIKNQLNLALGMVLTSAIFAAPASAAPPVSICNAGDVTEIKRYS